MPCSRYKFPCIFTVISQLHPCNLKLPDWSLPDDPYKARLVSIMVMVMKVVVIKHHPYW